MNTLEKTTHLRKPILDGKEKIPEPFPCTVTFWGLCWEELMSATWLAWLLAGVWLKRSVILTWKPGQILKKWITRGFWIITLLASGQWVLSCRANSKELKGDKWLFSTFKSCKMQRIRDLSTITLVVKSEIAQSCPTLCDPMDCGLPGSSVHGIFQARILEWVAISFSRGSSTPRNQTWVSCMVGRHFTVWATREEYCSRDYTNFSLMCKQTNQTKSNQPNKAQWFFCLEFMHHFV